MNIGQTSIQDSPTWLDEQRSPDSHIVWSIWFREICRFSIYLQIYYDNMNLTGNSIRHIIYTYSHSTRYRHNIDGSNDVTVKWPLLVQSSWWILNCNWNVTNIHIDLFVSIKRTIIGVATIYINWMAYCPHYGMPDQFRKTLELYYCSNKLLHRLHNINYEFI
jgi:hypothetical protein